MPTAHLIPAVFIPVSAGAAAGGGVCQCGNSLFPFDRRDVPEAGRGLQQLGLPVHDRSVVSLCGATPEALAAAKHPHALISSSVPAEEAGVDLGQKKDSYFYSCCHNNWCAAGGLFLGGTWLWTNETHQLWNPKKRHNSTESLFIVFFFFPFVP